MITTQQRYERKKDRKVHNLFFFKSKKSHILYEKEIKPSEFLNILVQK